MSQITNEIQYKTVKNFKIFIHPENVLPLIRSKQPFYAVTPYPRARYQSAIEPQIDFHEAQKQRRVMPQIMTEKDLNTASPSQTRSFPSPITRFETEKSTLKTHVLDEGNAEHRASPVDPSIEPRWLGGTQLERVLN